MKYSKNKTYKRKNSKKGKSRRNKMKGGSCSCNHSIMTGGLANSQYYNPLNTHNVDPVAPSVIVDSRLQPNMQVARQMGGKRKHKKNSSKKMKGGSIDMTGIFSKLANASFFPVSYSTNPIVSDGTIVGAVNANAITTGNATITNPSTTIHNIQSNGKYLV